MGGAHTTVSFASRGAYTLSGNGSLSAFSESIRLGTFIQTGGTNTISGPLEGIYVSAGTYSLSGSGRLAVVNGETLTQGSSFFQSSGVNVTGGVAISGNSGFQLSGGSLRVNSGMNNQGIFDGGNSSGTLSANCLLDLTSGTWQNVGHTTLALGANSLLIVPPNFNPNTYFGSYQNLGLTHTTGTTLVVPAGASITGFGSINDQVICQGTLTSYAMQGTGVLNTAAECQQRPDRLGNGQCQPRLRQPDGG